MTELKPCPFCGRNLFDLQYEDREDRGRSVYRWTAKIVCLNCFGSAMTHGFESTEEAAKQKAINAWNRRTKIETNIYDKEEIYPNCTVQVLTNTATGETSVGWWKNGGADDGNGVHN